MSDQQDLRARLPELPEPSIKVMGAINKNAPMNFYQGYTADQMRAYALEAAAQLGRVGDETIDCEIAVAPATIFSVGVKLSTVVSAVRARKEAEGTFAFTAKVRDRVAEPQLPAGVPDGWVLVPKVATKEMLDAGVDAAVNKAKGNPWCPYAWSAMLAAAPQPDSAAPDGDVEQRARELLAAEYEKASGTVKLSELVRKGRSPTDTIAIRAIIAALSAPKQVGVVPNAKPSLKYDDEGNGEYNYNEGWNDCRALMLAAYPQAAPVPVEGEGRRFRGVGHLESTGYIPPGSAAEREATPPPSQPAADLSAALEKATDRIVVSRAGRPDVELEEYTRGIRFHDADGIAGTIRRLRRYASEGSNTKNLLGQTMTEAADIMTNVLALIDGAKAGKGESK